MYKTIRTLAAIAIVLGTAFNTMAQKSFEGRIDYKINYVEIPDEMKGMESMLPQSMIFFLKGTKARMEQDGGMGNQTIVIVDSKTSATVVLMNFFGQKMAIEPTEEELKESKEAEEKIEVKIHDETKEIAGYTCKKATVTDPETGDTMTVYFTEEIQNGMADVKGVPGMPLEYVMEQEGIRMRVTASAVNKEKVADSQFDVPADYERMTSAQLQQKFQTLGE